MPTRRAILECLPEEYLRRIAESTGTNGLAGQSSMAIVDSLNETGQPTMVDVLGGLAVPQLRELCGRLGLDQTGTTREAFVHRLQVTSFEVGRTRVAILLPSRYSTLSTVPQHLRDNARSTISSFLTDLSGGADGGASTEELIGTFKQGTVYVDEKITRVYSIIDRSIYADQEKKQQLLAYAGRLCKELCQVCVGVEWGPELHFVSVHDRDEPQPAPFANLLDHDQDLYAAVALRRVQRVCDLAPLLALDRWTRLDPPRASHLREDLFALCEKGDRTAYAFLGTLSRADLHQLESALHDGDVLFDQSQEGGHVIRGWLVVSGRLRGSRTLSLPSPTTSISPGTLELTLSLLGSRRVERLEDVIDRQALTRRFYRLYRSRRQDLIKHLVRQQVAESEAAQQAQLLLSRLMFLRFLERRGLLRDQPGDPPDLLRQRCEACPRGQSIATDVIVPLLKTLDTPPEERGAPSLLPFLNGGLFDLTTNPVPDFPNRLLEPGRQGSVLHTLYRFEFVLEEHSGSGEVAIDPSIFGYVLESLCGDEEQKDSGVHYTPAVIGRTLAFEAIVRRLAGRTRIDYDKLREFGGGTNQEILSTSEARQVRDELPRLRIVDLAVGSGSLLLAAFEVLIDLSARANARLGTNLTPRSPDWSEHARRFIRECLYGVDINAEAVEVAKLRLWLALAVGEAEVRPLPGLSHNLRVGDSLSELTGAEEVSEQQDAFDDLRNALRVARSKYRAAEGHAVRQAASDLADAESRYQQAMGIEANASGPQPFLWKVHFHDVLRGKKGGFDVVIANPPYVRVQRLDERLATYQGRFTSLGKRNTDLYLAFVEQGLRLAHKEGGQLAFVLPNFSRSDAGQPLRELLARQTAVELWVDFRDIQIFSGANNYVVLLFATARPTRSREFPCRVVTPEVWRRAAGYDWFDTAPAGVVRYPSAGGEWAVASQEEAELLATASRHRRLGTIATVRSGIQTSDDEVFILEELGDMDGVPHFRSKAQPEPFPVEQDALAWFVKGSSHIRPFQALVGTYVIWTRSPDGALLAQAEIKRRFPLAWQYLWRFRNRLKERKGINEPWYGFRRRAAPPNCRRPGAILVPSMMRDATAHFDEAGVLAFPNSGKGGGGAWSIELRGGRGKNEIAPRWLLAVLNSSSLWAWLRTEGDPKKGGWRGVDRGLIQRFPIPVPSTTVQEQAAELTRRIEAALAAGEPVDGPRAELDQLVSAAWRSEATESATR
jgi:hypothetical protein